MNEVIEGGSQPEAPKRIHRSVDEKRRIVEATFAPRTSIARVARKHGVNSNQVFQWRYEYRKETLGGRSKPAAKLLPVVMVEPEAPSSVAAVAPQANSGGAIHVEFPGGISVHIGRDTGLHLLRAIVEGSVHLFSHFRFCIELRKVIGFWLFAVGPHGARGKAAQAMARTSASRFICR